MLARMHWHCLLRPIAFWLPFAIFPDAKKGQKPLVVFKTGPTTKLFVCFCLPSCPLWPVGGGGKVPAAIEGAFPAVLKTNHMKHGWTGKHVPNLMLCSLKCKPTQKCGFNEWLQVSNPIVRWLQFSCWSHTHMGLLQDDVLSRVSKNGYFQGEKVHLILRPPHIYIYPNVDRQTDR